MNAERIDEILQEFAFKPLGIRGAALISSEGQAVTVPIGMDESSALVVAGTMLHLAKRTNEEFRLQEIENITVRGRDGHVVLKNCNDEVFLLVRAGRALTGLLDVEINRTISKLQDELATNDGN